MLQVEDIIWIFGFINLLFYLSLSVDPSVYHEKRTFSEWENFVKLGEYFKILIEKCNQKLSVI